MNKMVRKLKKSNKALRFLYYLVMIFYVVGLVLFIKSLLSLTGIETMIRTIVIIFFIIYFLLYSFINLLNLLRRKYKGVIISTIFSLLFSSGFGSIGSPICKINCFLKVPSLRGFKFLKVKNMEWQN